MNRMCGNSDEGVVIRSKFSKVQNLSRLYNKLISIYGGGEKEGTLQECDDVKGCWD